MTTAIKFSIKQIAAQAGVSKATVDRVIHARGQVSFNTAQRVKLAIGELEEQHTASSLSGRTFYIDVLIQAPARFSSTVREAVNLELLQMLPFKMRPRFHFYESCDVESICQQMLKIAHSDSHGLLLKAPNDPLIAETVNSLFEWGTPVVTLVTDIPNSKRLVYVGIDNTRAGQLAAYLFSQYLNPPYVGTLLIVMSKECFFGEQERVSAFKQSLKAMHPQLQPLVCEGSDGVDEPTFWQIKKLIKTQRDIRGIYSVGGGNNAILQAFNQMGRSIDLFIGHDLDRDNRALLAQQKIQAIVHHNLVFDIHQAFKAFLHYHKVLNHAGVKPSKLEIITPFNLP